MEKDGTNLVQNFPKLRTTIVPKVFLEKFHEIAVEWKSLTDFIKNRLTNENSDFGTNLGLANGHFLEYSD
jgi:hypothetical protein